MNVSAIYLTAKVTPLIPVLANRSNVQSSKGLLRIGNRSFGLVQLRGLNLLPMPPARIIAFNLAHSLKKILLSTQVKVL